MDGMTLATPGQTPRARMKHPTLDTTSVTTGHYFIDLRLKAGWAIVPDPQNRLLKEYVNGASLKPHAPPFVPVEPKRRGRPRIKK
jgi:hypothetical protein